MWLFASELQFLFSTNVIATDYIIEQCRYSFKFLIHYNVDFNKENLFANAII